jgi:hypothetical protein
MLVYDITSEKSFDNIKNWIRNIEEVCKIKTLNKSSYFICSMHQLKLNGCLSEINVTCKINVKLVEKRANMYVLFNIRYIIYRVFVYLACYGIWY